MQERIPSAKFQGIGRLANHSLKFHKHSLDGSGKCSVQAGATGLSPVYGVLYKMRKDEQSKLHAYEGVGQGYEVGYVDIESDFGTIAAFTYIAHDRWIDDDLVPYHWYKSLVLEGAQYFNLPDEYVKQISLQPSKSDPDQERDALHQRILMRLDTSLG